MKKLFLILSVALGISLVSCNENTADSKSTEEAGETVDQKNHEVSTPDDIKPIYLTTEEFKEKVWNYEANPEEWTYKGDLPCVVDFYADWCKPCKMVAPIMDELADYYDGRVIVYKVNTDENRELSTVFQVRSIPSILFAPMEGKPAMQPGAMSKEQYIEIIDDFIIAKKRSFSEKDVEIIGTWNDYFDGNASHIVLFKKNGNYYKAMRDAKDNIEQEMILQIVDGQKRYLSKDENIFGEYYIINKKGELEVYDEKGYIEKYSIASQ